MKAPELGLPPDREQISARSISRGVWQQLGKTDLISRGGQVFAVFERACHVAFPGGEPVALVLAEIGDGPLNIVLGERPVVFPAVGQPVQAGGGRLETGRFEVTFDGAAIWEPRPDWERLRARAANIQGRLAHLVTLALALAERDSLVSILAPPVPEQGTRDQVVPAGTDQGWNVSICSVVARAARLLSLGWAGDSAQLRTAASRLAGVGIGLTPSGDDFLIGVMLWAWLAHPTPERICGPVLDGIGLHTTVLSAALLRAGCRGECGLPWHHLLEVLYVGADSELPTAVRSVLDCGHTSGADALAGFLWMGLETRLD